MRISDWSSDVCSSDLRHRPVAPAHRQAPPSLPACGGLPMLKFASISLLALAAATPAFAETIDGEPGDDIVVTASGIEQSRDEVGQAITIIDADTHERRQTVEVVELLAATPRVRFSRSVHTAPVARIYLRGGEAEQPPGRNTGV